MFFRGLLRQVPWGYGHSVANRDEASGSGPRSGSERFVYDKLGFGAVCASGARRAHVAESSDYRSGACRPDRRAGVVETVGREADPSGGERGDRWDLAHDQVQGQPDGYWWPSVFLQERSCDAVVGGSDAA